MNDHELELVAALSFIRADLERFVLGVLGSIDEQFQTVTWPAGADELGGQLVALGQTLQQHAAGRMVHVAGTRTVSSDSPAPLPEPPNDDNATKGGGDGNGDHARSGDG
jgi:hypothetical protein